MPEQAENKQLNSVRDIPASPMPSPAEMEPESASQQAPAASKKGMIDVLMQEAVVKLSQELGAADIGEHVKRVNMTAYVREQHPYAITQVKEGSAFAGYWKTRYIDPEGKRKTIYRKDSNDLIHFLYRYYREGAGATKTFKTVFEELLEYKRNTELRSERTIICWQIYYKKYMTELGDLSISEITEDILRKHIAENVIPKRPKKDAMHHMICDLKKVFWFARKQHYIDSSPDETLDYRDYRQHTDRRKKREEDTYFTVEETEKIRQYEWGCIDNPRALITLLCIETGMRADEPVALHKEDIHDGFIDIHRQQIRLDHLKPYQFVDVDYTKDTRTSEYTSRYFPITPRIQEIIDEALKLPGESVYLFHDAEGNMIKKDSYELYLRRHVLSLGITGKTNNHAFRKGLNTNVLIPKGIPVNERAALLGHTVRTNERNYSPRRKDTLDKLRTILSDEKALY